MDTREKIAESNRIEGIHRPPSSEEINEFDRFMGLEEVAAGDMVNFVSVYAPDAVLRDRSGLNVRVGGHIPPYGSPAMRARLIELLDRARHGNAWIVHCEYETLHPFTDGNGRSGRMLWYWMMRNNGMGELGFLHAFYYQTLREYRQ